MTHKAALETLCSATYDLPVSGDPQSPSYFPLLLHQALKALRGKGLTVAEVARLLPHVNSRGTLSNAAASDPAKKSPEPLAFRVAAPLADLALAREAITREQWEEFLYAWIRKELEKDPVSKFNIERLEKGLGAPGDKKWRRERREIIDFRLQYLAENGE